MKKCVELCKIKIMNKDFLDLTQPNYGYLSGSEIWKNNPTLFAGGALAVPKLDNLYEDLTGAAFTNLNTPGIFNIEASALELDFKVSAPNFAQNLEAIGHKPLSGTEISLNNFNLVVTGNFSMYKMEESHIGSSVAISNASIFNPIGENIKYGVLPTVESSFLKDIFTDNYAALSNKNMLVDACADLKSLSSITGRIYDNVYTETAVSEERATTVNGVRAPSWFENNLAEGHILQTHTRSDFEATGSVTLTAFDTYGPQSTVYYNTYTTNTHLCNNCGSPLSGTLTSGMSTVDVCQHLSSTDFSLLIRAVAFPQIFILITNEGCLGGCSASIGSCSLKKGNIMSKWI